MTNSLFHGLEAVIADALFPEVDLGLRRGRHIGKEDGAAYEYLLDAQAHLEGFYLRFGCELIQRSDGYFFLLPSGDRLGKKFLTQAAMLAGQMLALFYLDPATSLQSGGCISRDALLQRLESLMSTETLFHLMCPRKRKYDERIAAQTVREEMARALRELATLGFVELLDESQLKLRASLMRFADPVRGLEDVVAAMERLIAKGEIVCGTAEAEAGDHYGSLDDEDGAPDELDDEDGAP
jgi:chromosome partition protein MukE